MKVAERWPPASTVMPEMVAAQLRELQELGVNHVLLRFLGQWNGESKWIAQQSMKLFSEQVMPALQ